MAINEFQTLSDDSRSEYEAAMRAGKIVQLKNGTNVKQDKVLNFEDGHLVIWKPTGEKMTTGEAMRRHIGVYEWVDPLEGPYQGRPVCVSFTMLHGKSPLP